MIDVVDVLPGSGPLVLSMPHAGTDLPDAVAGTLNGNGLAQKDTDWHIDHLYASLLPDASLIKARFHRYVIDANRGPEDGVLYPGQNTTGLCPLSDFDGKAIYKPGCEPDAAEIEYRLKMFHTPYHDAVRNALDRAKQQYGFAVLIDCHSIRSYIPHLFEGLLPDLNIGSNSGVSSALAIQDCIVEVCRANPQFSWVLNGRFKGGWTTRHYGQPQQNVHAIQIEIAQQNYMQEHPPWDWLAERAAVLRTHLQSILNSIDTLARSGTLLSGNP